MKIAIVSESLPPAQGGQSIILYRLLQNLNSQDYCLISPHKWVDEDAALRESRQLPGKYYQLPNHFLSGRGAHYSLANLREDAAIPFAILSRAKRITDIIRREKCDIVIGCTGDVLDIPASYIASRRAEVPFYAYIFDHYSYREWYNSARRFWAKQIEPLIMKGATGVIVPNEVLRDDLRRHYGIEATVIHNSFDISEYEALGNEPSALNDDEIKIVYTGDIYEAHYDAFRNLLAAIEMLEHPGVKLHIYTSRSTDELARENIHGPLVYHPHHAPGEMPPIQRQAHLLFLPLAFKSPYPDLVRTSATTKLGEYLAVRRPVLVHAPEDSFAAWYFREHRCGMVVDRSDPAALAKAIRQVLYNKSLQQELSERAWERAQVDFNISTARIKFMELLKQGIA